MGDVQSNPCILRMEGGRVGERERERKRDREKETLNASSSNHREGNQI